MLIAQLAFRRLFKTAVAFKQVHKDIVLSPQLIDLAKYSRWVCSLHSLASGGGKLIH